MYRVALVVEGGARFGEAATCEGSLFHFTISISRVIAGNDRLILLYMQERDA